MIPLSNNRILVIDDNPSIHEDFLKILGGGVASSASLVEAESILFGNTPERDLNRGFELDFAFQGQEALEKVEAAIKAGKPDMCYSKFSVGAQLTEIMLLGCVALRAGQKIEWDGPNMRATNCPEAAQFVKRTNRDGWALS